MEQKTIRCAVYARKSTEEGLDKEFNTLEAQREAEGLFKDQLLVRPFCFIRGLAIFQRPQTMAV